MKINDALRELWKNNFFNSEKSVAEVDEKLRADYGITCSNTLMQLKSCKKFLRKNPLGWIQKISYCFHEENKKENVHPFDFLMFYPEINIVSRKLFDDGHYSQAVFEAFKKVNNMVKDKSNLQIDGKDLMLKVFNETNPILRLNQLESVSERNEQEGYKFIFAGSMVGIRNPKAHDNIFQDDPKLTIQFLSLANLLIRQIKQSTRKN